MEINFVEKHTRGWTVEREEIYNESMIPRTAEQVLQAADGVKAVDVPATDHVNAAAEAAALALPFTISSLMPSHTLACLPSNTTVRLHYNYSCLAINFLIALSMALIFNA